jgi:ketosteroid isomerase-like protein
MEKNKTGKYFKYAIGMILLLVIGNLINLQMHNWNDTRKQALEDAEILQSTKTESQPDAVDMVIARELIESNIEQFAEDFKRGDSLALAGHYASDGTLGSIKGTELVSAWGGIIRNAVKNGTPNVRYTINSLFSDGEYLIELGIFENSDNNNNVKSQGKYLVVWKMEDGKWKIYRDIGL